MTPRLLMGVMGLPVRGPRRGSRSAGGEYDEVRLGCVEFGKSI